MKDSTRHPREQPREFPVSRPKLGQHAGFCSYERTNDHVTSVRNNSRSLFRFVLLSWCLRLPLTLVALCSALRRTEETCPTGSPPLLRGWTPPLVYRLHGQHTVPGPLPVPLSRYYRRTHVDTFCLLMIQIEIIPGRPRGSTLDVAFAGPSYPADVASLQYPCAIVYPWTACSISIELKAKFTSVSQYLLFTKKRTSHRSSTSRDRFNQR